MKLNTASSVILLLSAAEICSAFKSRKRNEVVADVDRVIVELVESNKYDSGNLKNKIPPNFELTLNEKYCLSTVKYGENQNETLKQLKLAFEKAKEMDEEEETKIPDDTTAEQFYERVLAYHTVSQFCREFEIIENAGILPEVKLAHEYAKLFKMSNIPKDTITKILTEPSTAVRDLATKKTELIGSIHTILLGDQTSVKASIATKMLGGIDSFIVDRLLEIVDSMPAAISDVLVEYGFFDDSIGALNYRTTARNENDLVNALLKFKTSLRHVITILEYAHDDDFKSIVRMSKWADGQKLPVPLIKSILFHDDNEIAKALDLMQIAEIKRLKEALEEDLEVSLSTFKFLTQSDIEFVLNEKKTITEDGIRARLNLKPLEGDSSSESSGEESESEGESENESEPAGPAAPGLSGPSGPSGPTGPAGPFIPSLYKGNRKIEVIPLHQYHYQPKELSSEKAEKVIEMRNKRKQSASTFTSASASASASTTNIPNAKIIFLSAASLVVICGGVYFLKRLITADQK